MGRTVFMTKRDRSKGRRSRVKTVTCQQDKREMSFTREEARSLNKRRGD